MNYEGIVSKNADAPYRSERTEAWQKIKTVQKGRFPVVGFVKDPSGVAALYLGKREGKDLVYIGKGHGLESNYLSQNTESARHRCQPEVETDKAHSKAQGHLG